MAEERVNANEKEEARGADRVYLERVVAGDTAYTSQSNRAARTQVDQRRTTDYGRCSPVTASLLRSPLPLRTPSRSAVDPFTPELPTPRPARRQRDKGLLLLTMSKTRGLLEEVLLRLVGERRRTEGLLLGRARGSVLVEEEVVGRRRGRREGCDEVL